MSHESDEQARFEEYCLQTYQDPDADYQVGEYDPDYYAQGVYDSKPRVRVPTREVGVANYGRRHRRSKAQESGVKKLEDGKEEMEENNRSIWFEKAVAHLHHIWEIEDANHVKNMETFSDIFLNGTPIMELREEAIINRIIEIHDQSYESRKLKRGEEIRDLDERRHAAGSMADDARIANTPYQYDRPVRDSQFDRDDGGRGFWHR
jgi:hypothetical protein